MAKKVTVSKWYQHSRSAWDILVELAPDRERDTTYGDLSKKIGAGGPNNAKSYLNPISAYCWVNELPQLTVLVRYKNPPYTPSGEFIDEWLTPFGETVETACQKVRGQDWTRDRPTPTDFMAAHIRWKPPNDHKAS